MIVEWVGSVFWVKVNDKIRNQIHFRRFLTYYSLLKMSIIHCKMQ